MELTKDRIEEIKREYAQKWHHGYWGSFLVTAKMNDWQLLDFHLNQVIKLIQAEIVSNLNKSE